MSSLKDILESHPIKNLKAVIKDVKSELAPKLALSKDKKRHSKEQLIEHIMKLDKMGLIKKLPDMYVKPKRKPRVKRPSTPQLGDDDETHVMADGTEMTGATHSPDSKAVKTIKTKGGITIDLKKAKKGGIKVDVKKATKAPSAWTKHLAEFRKQNPDIKGKAVMIEAKKTYKK